MGVMIYRRVTNVYDIPPDILVNCIGKGLVVVRDEHDAEEHGHEHESRPPCSLEVDVGNGLHIDCDNHLAVNIGNGLEFNCDGQIEIDTEPVTTQIMTNVTDISLSIDGQKLTLSKTFTDYIVHKTAAGLVVDIEVSDSRIVTEDVLMVDYGYCGSGTSARMSTPNLPNFYQK